VRWPHLCAFAAAFWSATLLLRVQAGGNAQRRSEEKCGAFEDCRKRSFCSVRERDS